MKTSSFSTFKKKVFAETICEILVIPKLHTVAPQRLDQLRLKALRLRARYALHPLMLFLPWIPIPGIRTGDPSQATRSSSCCNIYGLHGTSCLKTNTSNQGFLTKEKIYI